METVLEAETMPPRMSRLAAYVNRKMLMILFLGFSSGLPIALAGSTLQAWFKVAGVDIVTIGFLGLVGQPYSYKYLWAPLMDRYIPPFLGRRRGWMFIAQTLICVILFAMTFFNPTAHPVILGGLALLLAFCSASQDIAIDAYKVDVLKPNERGLGAALGVEGYRLAMLVSGGGALILADQIGWQKTYWVMITCMFIGILAAFFAPEPEADHNPDSQKLAQKDLFQSIVETFRDFLTREQALWFLALIVLYKLGDAFSLSFSTAFLLELKFSLTEVGIMHKSVGLISSLVGIVFGGLVMTKVGLYRSLLFFGILQAISNLFYMALAIVGKHYVLTLSVYAIEYLCGGMGTAAFVALLMSLCNAKFSATQYALFSSFAVLGRVYVSPVAGFMVKYLGWTNFYLATFFIALPSLCVIRHLKSQIEKRD